MKRSKAVASALKSLKLELDLETEEWQYVAHHLQLMYQIGFEQGNCLQIPKKPTELGTISTKQVNIQETKESTLYRKQTTKFSEITKGLSKN